METLQVALGRRSYPIYIGGGLLEQAEELLRPLGVGRWAIVCDDTVAALYGAPLARRTGWPLVTFPAGEGSKSLEEYDRLCRRLVQLGLPRSDGIVALGAVIRGATPHFDYVCNEASKGIAQVMLQYKTPIGFGLLTCDSIEQAIERAGSKGGNKGVEAAAAMLETIRVLEQL